MERMNSQIDIVEKFRSVTDALGYGIEDGIIETVAYLNELGFPTTQSCEGHTEDHGYPFAWVELCTDIESRQLQDTSSATSVVHNDSWHKATTATEDLPESSLTHDLWDSTYEEAEKGHLRYKESLEEEKQRDEEYEGLLQRTQELVFEFCTSTGRSMEELCLEKVSERCRINFCTKEEYLYFKDLQHETAVPLLPREEVHVRACVLSEEFKVFLKQKYINPDSSNKNQN